jgi:hypothetical protein
MFKSTVAKYAITKATMAKDRRQIYHDASGQEVSLIWKFLIRGWKGPSKRDEGLCQRMHEVHDVVMYSRYFAEDGANVGIIEFANAVGEEFVDGVMSDLYPNGTYEVGFWEPTVSGDKDFGYGGWNTEHRRTLRTQANLPTCCLCHGAIHGYGNNAQPCGTGRACDGCNAYIVIPARLKAK